jgi:glutathione S-transferase
MYELHIANRNYSSWSLRPWVLMRELEIAFEEHLHPFRQDTSFDAFRAFSPSGKVPCLRDGETVVWDSLAIVEYLAEHRAGVWPTDAGARAWARSAAAEMHSGFNALRAHCSMNCGIRVSLAAQPAALTADIARLDELWCEGLQRFGGPFLAGTEFTAVDAFFAPVAFRFQTYGLQAGATAMAYVQRLLELASMVEWYQSALAEPWREQAHEDEVRAAGVWLADLRAPAA